MYILKKTIAMSVASIAVAGFAVSAQAATTNGFANGGFETAGATTPAASWLQAAAGYSRDADSHTGSFSALLASPLFNAAVMLQNSKDQGGLPNLTVGDTPTLSFWAKGSPGPTGNALFAIRYLDDIGNVKANSGNVFFHGSINVNTWTEITYNLGAVPAGATAAFIEFSQGKGDLGPIGRVLIDDVYLGVTAVPEPGTYALLLAGLGLVGYAARRRKSA